jgi:hypothetical protein
LGNELPEGIEPDGEHEDVGPLDRLVDAHHFRVAVEVSSELPCGLLVASGQEEVLTPCREVCREPAADVAGADDRDRAAGTSHLRPPLVVSISV